MANAAKIARQFRRGTTSLKQLQSQHHCAYTTLLRALETQMSKREYTRLCKKRMEQAGVKTQFRPGYQPWNKGRKGIHHSPATEFKKGHLPQTHKHNGTISIRNDKCGKQVRWIKVSGIMQGRHKWISHGRYVWQQKNGPVPDGYFVVHVDGNTLNDDLVNLQIVNHREHLALQHQRDPNTLKKCRRNAAKSNRKRHSAARRERARLVRRQQLNIKRATKEADEKTKFESRLQELRKTIKYWECIGCGANFGSEPPQICPKCNGLRFKNIKQRIKETG